MYFDERPEVKRLEKYIVGCVCAAAGLCLLTLVGAVVIVAFLVR